MNPKGFQKMEPNDRRPDVDIEEEIELLIRSFAPLKASRSYFTAKSTGGHVVLAGNIRSPQARRVLVDNIPHIKGVSSVDSTNLYDDEMVRLAVGQLLPAGIVASVHYGAVALTGELPVGASGDVILNAVKGVAGVRRVGAEFGQSAAEPSSSTS
jgi:osmotically-inducible protein OsmY